MGSPLSPALAGLWDSPSAASAVTGAAWRGVPCPGRGRNADCRTLSLVCSAFLAEQREEERQLKAELQQVDLLMLADIKEYLVSAAIRV